MRVLSIILGILIMIAGIVFLVHPAGAVVAIGVIFSVGLILGGINTLIAKFSRGEGSGWNVFFGIISILCGIFLLAYGLIGSFAITFVMALFMAISIIMSGIAGIAGSMENKKMGESWGFMMFIGILSIIVGLVALFAPMFAGGLLVVMFSIALIMQGANLIAFGSFMGKVKKVIEGR